MLMGRCRFKQDQMTSDDKKNARLIISKIIPDTFNSLKMHYMKTDAKRRQELLSIRDLLVKEGPAGD
jgi:hypothetical protein